MREVSSAIQTSIESPSGQRVVAKAQIDPSRTFFSSLLDDDPYDSNDYSETTDNPVGQCMCYSPAMEKVYTFVVDSTTGSIFGMEQGDNTKNDMSLDADKDTKPACWELGDGTAYLWYWDDSDKLMRVLVDLSDFSTSGSTEITIDNLPAAWTVTAGSPHALSATQIAFTYQTSIGGIGVGYYDGNWSHWNQRFLSVTGVTARDWTIYSTAVIFDNRVFVYMTDINEGYVRGTKYNPYKNLWSDSFEALPADLSRFCITNAISAGGYVHISGQFHRTEDWADAKIYSLVVRSLDGYTFSWDRFTLLSTLGFQFQISLATGSGENYLYASDRNSVGVAAASYFFVSNPNDSIVLEPPNDLIAVTIESATDASLDITTETEEYFDESVIAKNNRVILYLGYETSSGYEYVEYQRYIIDKRTTSFTDQDKTLNLELVDQATWKTQQIAFPFYAEILSKTSFHDDCNLQDQTYPVATVSPYMPEFLILDFWNNTKWDGDGTVTDGVEYQFRSGEGGCAFKSPNMDDGDNDKIKFRTVKLAEYHLLSEYPTVRTAGTATARLFGWETAAEWFEGDSSSRPNSTWECFIVTADPENLDDKTVTQGTLTSTYAKFPQYYPDDEDGSYPIEWSFSGLTEDDVILYFGFTVENDTEGVCTICPERMEISGIDYLYTSAGTSQAWETSNPDKDTYSREYLKNPDTKIPSILFTMRPYSAFNFRVSGDFIYSAGSNPISVGRTCWGVVGLAEDGKDYIVARYHRQKSRVELVLVRSNNETTLAFTDPILNCDSVMMDHRDGYFRVWYRYNSTEWVGPEIEYHYDEVTHGRISMSTQKIMHTGVYTAVAPPGFLIPSYQMDKSDGIGMIASSDDSVLDAFPTTGQVIIDGQVYEYSGKTPRTNDYLGPFQGRRRLQDYWKTYREGGITYTGHGVEVTAWWPDSDPYRYQNMLLSADRGRTWQITKSDWQVYDTTAGVRTLLPNRSRHYCPSLSGRSPITMGQRVNFVSGLLDIEPVGSTDPGYHLYGAWCALHGTDEIWVKNIEANTVTRDATVKDMVGMLCKSASINPEFPGDTSISTLSLSTTPQELTTEEPYLPGGFDVRFTIPALTSGDWIALYAGELYIGDPDDAEKIDIGIKNDAGVLQVFSDPQDDVSDDEYINTVFDVDKSYEVRVLFHSTYCSVYLDDIWVQTFSYAEESDITGEWEKVITWPDKEVKLYLHSNTTGYSATGILVTELFDWREAIYVESETNAASAMASVIQERPIENSPTVDGGVSFSHFLVRDDVEYLPTTAKSLIHRHEKAIGTIPDSGSDAIVIFTDVEFADNPLFATYEGFLTRVYKLSSLETGARKTAIIMLRKAWEHQYQHNILMLPDVRLQIGDRFTFGYRLSGSGRYEQETCVVEDLNIQLAEGNYEMAITGYRSTKIILRANQGAFCEGTT